MGANGSSLAGKASLAPSLRLHGLTSARLLQVDAMFDRFRGMGSTFALGLAAFENLTSLEGVAARQIFREIFDTDRNGLVDAYEVMGCLTLCSQLTKAEKIERMYRMFDFNGAGGLTLDELTMLLRCAAYSCAKTDPALSFPVTDEVEVMSTTAFELAQVDTVEGEMTLAHFQDYCTVPLVAMFLDYFDSPLCQVRHHGRGWRVGCGAGRGWGSIQSIALVWGDWLDGGCASCGQQSGRGSCDALGLRGDAWWCVVI